MDKKYQILSHFFYSVFSLYGGMRFNDNRRLKKIIIEKNIDLIFVDNSVIGTLSNWIYKNTNSIAEDCSNTLINLSFALRI